MTKETNQGKMIGVLPSQDADPIIVRMAPEPAGGDMIETNQVRQIGILPSEGADPILVEVTNFDAKARAAVYDALPAFHAYVNATQSDVTGDDTNYFLTGAFWTEVLDSLGNFSNGIFTAPVTGLYLFSGYIYLTGIADGHTEAAMMLRTSNRNYYIYYNNIGALRTGSYFIQSFAIMADMQVDDVASLRLTVYAGNKTIDVVVNTFFSGVLVHR